ncbi:MAG TPA: helix-turn-helix transcriptional regulator [Spirochaetota bacterium]|nr:helix-turn-helix transcriptional regulator [Spirochaetota bacterium]HOS32116.1 helix-turn-helix transcriptional regulator [Spirochaetota bacterium]HOS55457.1 helix-turn-helix transcriptional regulator [Spirochaetota bacterium]HQF77983.1 helix-turn-helix transcriptional regulator [Spirochaetota bacterium]HQH29793.1 helix-turn-helix transcriptional regulator [Spirochaetota bacterium]
MEALGEFLKEARIKANLSIMNIAEETHIMKKFIEAIEKEEFSAFPGDAYLKGFLRTYSEYLGLDSEEIIRKYERIKMAETPTPMEQLIPKPKYDFRPIIVVILIILTAVGLVVGGFFGVRKIIRAAKTNDKDKIEKVKDTTAVKETKANVYKLSEKEKSLNSLKKGDIIEFTIDSNDYRISVAELSPTVILNYGSGMELFLVHNYQHKLDMNGDERNDIEIVLNQWDKSGANIAFKLYDQSESTLSSLDGKNLRGENPETIVTRDIIEELSFSLNFSNDQFLRYQIDDKEAVESYFNAGASLNIKAAKYVILWLTNAGAASLNFFNYGKIFSPGESGKCEVKLIRWEKNNLGGYDLQSSSLK